MEGAINKRQKVAITPVITFDGNLASVAAAPGKKDDGSITCVWDPQPQTPGTIGREGMRDPVVWTQEELRVLAEGYVCVCGRLVTACVLCGVSLLFFLSFFLSLSLSLCLSARSLFVVAVYSFFFITVPDLAAVFLPILSSVLPQSETLQSK
jgi:hypothetical protein